MRYAFDFDPREVLGVSSDASLAQIQEAYRVKSKKHHPDVGGDEWVFRIVSRSYEILCSARVMGRASEVIERTEAPRQQQGQRQQQPRASRPGVEDRGERIRAGVKDQGFSRDRMVFAELLLLRFEVENPLDLLSESAADRNLSCNLNLSWPKPGAELVKGDGQLFVADLAKGFKAASKAARPLSSNESTEGGRYSAWLSFGTAREADLAFRAFKSAVNAAGIGVDQSIRELTIPRAWDA